MAPEPAKKGWWEDDPSDPARFSLQEVGYATVVDKADVEPWTRIGVQPKNDDERDWRGVRRKDIQILPMPEELKALDQPYKRGYHLFDTPDYTDPFAKLWWTLKYSFLGSVALYTGAVGTGIVYTRNTPKFVAKYTLYSVGACMITASSAILISQLRGKKDDWINWSSGAFMAALWMGNIHGWPTWWKVCIYGMPAAAVIKNTKLDLLHKKDLSKYRVTGIYGSSADQGWKSGDFRFGITRNFVERARRQM